MFAAVAVTNSLSVWIASAETITVCADGCDHTSIQAAIDTASNGDVIQLAAETYFEGTTINTRGKAIELRGAVGPDGVPASILDGGRTHRVMRIDSGESGTTILSDLIFRHGAAVAAYPGSYGGGLETRGTSPVLRRCVFEANVAIERGGGLAIYGGSPTITDCDFIDNHGDIGGGVHLIFSSATILDCVFDGNTASYGGGAMNPAGGTSSARIENCVFQFNSSWKGGAIYSRGESAQFTTCEFVSNVGTYGGAVFAYQARTSNHACRFFQNVGSRGSNFSGSDDAIITLTACEVDDCCTAHPASIVQWDEKSLFEPWCDDCRGNLDCVGDRIDASDLGYLLGRWGSDDPQSDLNEDGIVSAPDLGLLLGAWGDCK